MSEKQRRPKSHFVQNKKKRKTREGHLGLDDLKSSTKGIIATANFLDYGCKREVFSLLDDFSLVEKKVETDVCGDVDDEIAKEIAELKQVKKRFQIVDTTLNNFMFIAVNDDTLDVCQLVHKILTTLRESKQRKTRFTQRFLPVTHTCYASVEDIAKTSKLMLQDQFYNNTPKTFGIIFKSRNNSSISRDAVIKEVASVAVDTDTYTEFNKVDLDNPEYTIIINVVKTVVFMGTVKDFKLLSKYNIDELTKGFVNPYSKKSDCGEKVAETDVGNDVSLDEKTISMEQKEKANGEENADILQKADEVEC